MRDLRAIKRLGSEPAVEQRADTVEAAPVALLTEAGMSAVMTPAGVAAEARGRPEPEEKELAPLSIGHEAEAALAIGVIEGQAKKGVRHGSVDWGEGSSSSAERGAKLGDNLGMSDNPRFTRNPYIDLHFAELSEVFGVSIRPR
jgi:hypothetical protein